MNNRFFIILLIFVSVGIISSCSSDEEVATTSASAAASAAGSTVGLTDTGGVATTWSQACNMWCVGCGSDQGELVFDGATASYNWAMYNSDNCTGVSLRHDNESYTMVPSTVATTVTNETDNASVSAYKNDWKVVDLLRAFDNQTDLDRANTDNSSAGCGLTDWTLNTSKSVAGLACNNSDSTDKQMAIGDKLYTMFYVNGTSLQFNTSLGDNITIVGSTIYTKQ